MNILDLPPEGSSNNNGLNSRDTILAYFWAEWCGPCKRFSPILQSINDELIHVVKINADEESELANQYGVRAIPTVLMISNGKVIRSLTGATSRDKVESWVMETAATHDLMWSNPKHKPEDGIVGMFMSGRGDLSQRVKDRRKNR